METRVPKVCFVFDSEKEVQYIGILKGFGAKPLASEDQRLFDTNLSEFKKNIEKLYRDEVKRKIEADWGIIEGKYFSLVEKVTGHQWLHRKYTVILTSTMLGLCNPSNPETNEVAVSFNFPNIVINYIIAHEIFHSHYFQIVNKMGSDKLFSTELNENCAVFALLFTEIKKLFPFADDTMIESCIKSHENAAKYFNELHSLWNRKKDFDDYLVRSIKVI